VGVPLVEYAVRAVRFTLHASAPATGRTRKRIRIAVCQHASMEAICFGLSYLQKNAEIGVSVMATPTQHADPPPPTFPSLRPLFSLPPRHLRFQNQFSHNGEVERTTDRKSSKTKPPALVHHSLKARPRCM